MVASAQFLPKASTGIAGLDQVLEGGWARNRLHLLEGSPGTGKTTIALQFLLDGAQKGETGIYLRRGAFPGGSRLGAIVRDQISD